MKTSAILLILFSLMNLNDKPDSLSGSWQWENSNEIHSIIFSDKFYSVTEYNIKDKKFIATYGGSWSLKDNSLLLIEEFNTIKPDDIGKEKSAGMKIDKNAISVSFKGTSPQVWKRIDSNEPGLLAGAWLITGRKNNGEMSKMTPGARRTMKILSGTKFQWIAYNTETKEFFGTGGGSYSTVNGKYAENIEFFSRDNGRVGTKLEFNFSLDNGNWHHSGLSSKGDPIDEVWTRRELLGL